MSSSEYAPLPNTQTEESGGGASTPLTRTLSRKGNSARDMMLRADAPHESATPSKESVAFDLSLPVADTAAVSSGRSRATSAPQASSTLRRPFNHELEIKVELKAEDAEARARLDDDVLAPIWFESESFRLISENNWVYWPIQTLLCLAPILTSLGSFLELLFDCPTHSVATEAFFAFGTFSFVMIWPALFYSLSRVVRGAHRNPRVVLAEKKKRDTMAQDLLAIAEQSAIQIQRTVRGHCVRKTLRDRKLRVRYSSNTSLGGMSSDLCRARWPFEIVAHEDKLGVSESTKLRRTRSIDELADTELELHVLQEVHKQRRKAKGELPSDMPVHQHRLAVARLVVEGVYTMQDRVLEEKIEQLEFRRCENQAEKELFIQYGERAHTSYHDNGSEAGYEAEESFLHRCCLSDSDNYPNNEPDLDLPSSSFLEKDELETRRQVNMCGCYASNETNCLGSKKKRKTKQQLEEDNGPFTKLAFDSGPAGSRRVYLTREAYNSLIRWRAAYIVVGVVFAMFAVGMFCGILDLLRADFDSSMGNTFSRHANDLFFPSNDCMSKEAAFKHAYGLGLLVIWFPSCLIAAVVWPCWLMSLLLVSVHFRCSVFSFSCCLLSFPPVFTGRGACD